MRPLAPSPGKALPAASTAQLPIGADRVQPVPAATVLLEAGHVVEAAGALRAGVALTGRRRQGLGVHLPLVGLKLTEGEETPAAVGARDHLSETLRSVGHLLLQKGAVRLRMGPLHVLVQVRGVSEGHETVWTGEELTRMD